VTRMLARVLRVGGLLVLGALGVWWGRLVAHSKIPPPEGRWREITPEELA
jgi:hypothetical protein